MSDQNKKENAQEKAQCCGCSCDPSKLAQFLRHIAEFFDKKTK